MSYTPTRIQDLQTLDLPTVGSIGIKIYDVMRIFTGDNPTRQFECGQQRGGNYSCLCGIHVKDHSIEYHVIFQTIWTGGQFYSSYKHLFLWNPIHQLGRSSSD
jgi:hypothetical protein